MCLSGGVDSSVAAALLVKAGYDVTAAFMVNYDEVKNGVSCWHPDYQDALRVAAKLGIKLLRLDFTKEYARDVLQYMYAEYDRGRTPNPDVLCNKFIKFGVWLDRAQELGFDFIATGHYARIKKQGKNVLLMAAKDQNKDQTYFLHQLNQQQLSHTLFPIGDYTKEEVRKLAHKFDLSTAQKEESMGICFIGEVSMKDFLKDKVKAKPGNILDTAGKILGEHSGLPFYTIGQRGLGLGNTGGKTLFVVDKDISKNELIVGEENDPRLYKKETTVEDLHWVSPVTPKWPLKCKVRLRHRQELQDATINASYTIKFSKPQRAVTPGQFAVFYSSPLLSKSNVCLGGGIIS